MILNLKFPLHRKHTCFHYVGQAFTVLEEYNLCNVRHRAYLISSYLLFQQMHN
jgi:hypothetical protein